MNLNLHETSHPGSVPSSDRPIKITATNKSVFPENQLGVKKKAMALYLYIFVPNRLRNKGPPYSVVTSSRSEPRPCDRSESVIGSALQCLRPTPQRIRPPPRVMALRAELVFAVINFLGKDLIQCHLYCRSENGDLRPDDHISRPSFRRFVAGVGRNQAQTTMTASSWWRWCRLLPTTCTSFP